MSGDLESVNTGLEVYSMRIDKSVQLFDIVLLSSFYTH